jgi:hypothetical protein
MYEKQKLEINQFMLDYSVMPSVEIVCIFFICFQFSSFLVSRDYSTKLHDICSSMETIVILCETWNKNVF